jgi:hypothetical protein
MLEEGFTIEQLIAAGLSMNGSNSNLNANAANSNIGSAPNFYDRFRLAPLSQGL